MKIKLLVSRSGPSGVFSRGDEIEVDDAEAVRMFAAVPPQAEPLRDAPVEKAVKKNDAAKAVKG